jgi:hypothetical protein
MLPLAHPDVPAQQWARISLQWTGVELRSVHVHVRDDSMHFECAPNVWLLEILHRRAAMLCTNTVHWQTGNRSGNTGAEMQHHAHKGSQWDTMSVLLHCCASLPVLFEPSHGLSSPSGRQLSLNR